MPTKDRDSSANDPDPSDIAGRPADPFVRSRMAGAGDPPPQTVSLSGLLGDSDREGRRRLYFTTRLDYYAEFLNDDVIAVEDVAADQPPFVGLDATRVTLKRDARVDYIHTRVAGPADEFDLDVRGVGRAVGPGFPTFETLQAECPGPSFGGGCPTDFNCGTQFECPSGFTVCKPRTCGVTCEDICITRGVTCGGTCRGTCADTCQRTCADTCGATCVTCPTGCNVTCGPTCNAVTCGPTCNAVTCGTCFAATCDRVTCADTCIVTCGATCGGATCGGTCFQDTCADTCSVTCGATCAGATCGRTCFQATCGATCFRTCGPICEPTQLPTNCFTCRC